jgi:L-seryl-tRNA(Ser) seleniumtransferase
VPDNAALRQLPSVDRVIEEIGPLTARFPRRLVGDEVRRVLAAMRRSGAPDPDAVPGLAVQALEALEQPSLRDVINATGVVLHTNLGRAPLPRFSPPEAYSNLEYDLESGRRGKRDVHLTGLLERLLGAPGIAVNNNAAAVYLALNELAAGHEVIISRGELIEIGDGFRIPDIMRRAGVDLREVGTTNRTSIADYRGAIGDRTRLILRVHPSNFRISGFTSRPGLAELAALAREFGLPLYEDLGSGCLVDLRPAGVSEPLATESLASGVNLVSFSGDKLMGGPQAGILAGDAALVARLRRNPMFRALRVDKLIYQALEITLRNLLLERYDRIPALAMVLQPLDHIRARAESLARRLQGLRVEFVDGESVIGGGSTPEQSIPTVLVAIEVEDVASYEAALRRGSPPVIARIENNRLLVDLRTVLESQQDALAEALQARS